MTVPDNTPVLIGAGQISDDPRNPHFAALSPSDLAAQAVAGCLADAGLTRAALASVDRLSQVRTFADSVPDNIAIFLAPLGRSATPPRSVARRLDWHPPEAVYSVASGDQPQKLVFETCEAIASGAIRAGVICGAEAIATQRALAQHGSQQGARPDWNEHAPGAFEDRGADVERWAEQAFIRNKIYTPLEAYGLIETARRLALGQDDVRYRETMAALFTRFAAVAADNPLAFDRSGRDAAAMATPDARNRRVQAPYTKSLIARDTVSQGAAVLIAAVAQAREWGVPESAWVFLHGHGEAEELPILARPQLHESPAMAAAYQAALAGAQISADEIAVMDLYSCFPIAVFEALRGLGIDADDPRAPTLTGGLPFFGGPGNNYSLHAIAEVIRRLRCLPGRFGLVGANGGILSKHAVGVYGTTPCAFPGRTPTAPYPRNAQPMTLRPEGAGVVESYTHNYDDAGNVGDGFVVGRLEATGERFVARSEEGGAVLLQERLGVPGAAPGKVRINVIEADGQSRYRLMP